MKEAAVLLAGVAGLGLSIAMLVDGFNRQRKQQPQQVIFEEKEEEEEEDRPPRKPATADKAVQTGGRQQRSFSSLSVLSSAAEEEEERGDEDMYIEEEVNDADECDAPELLSPRTSRKIIEGLVADDEASEVNNNNNKDEPTGLLATIKRAYRVSFAASESALEKNLST